MISALILVGFCFNLSGVQAGKRINTVKKGGNLGVSKVVAKSRKRVGCTKNNAGKNLDFKEKLFESKFNEYRDNYYKNGLSKCEGNSIFHVGVECDGEGMSIIFSPTWVNRIRGDVFKLEDGRRCAFLNGVVFEIVDRRGKVFRFKRNKLVPLFNMDIVYIFVPNASNLKEVPSVIECQRFDEGFKMQPGNEYDIHILDSNGEVLVSGRCVAENSNLGDLFSVSKRVAHPEVFDEDFCKSGLKMELGLC